MIAIIGTKYSIPIMKEMLGNKNQGFELEYFSYSTTENMKDIFKSNKKIEGILFSGPLGVERFESIEDRPLVPYSYSYSDDLILTSFSLLDILLKYPGISPEKIYIDYFNFFKMEKTKFYEYYPEALKEKVKYYKFDKLSNINQDEILKDIKDKYENGEIEVALLIFCRDRENLDKIGIPYKLERNILPYSVITAYNNLIKQIEITSIKRKNIYTLALKSKENIEYIKENVLNYYPNTNINQFDKDIILFDIPSTDIFYDERKLRCKTFSFLSKKYNISVGIGEGKKRVEVEHNAIEALNYSLEFGKEFCFIMTYERNIIGPSNSKISLKMNEYELKAIYQKSRQLGIKPFNLCRLMALFDLNEVINTQEVAKYLNIAHRSSNRILNILSENNIILEVKNNENNVGRPKKQYMKKDNISSI